MEPGIEPVRVAESGQVAPGDDERLLQRILRSIDVAQDPVAEREQAAEPSADQVGERLAVAVSCRFDEIVIHSVPILDVAATIITDAFAPTIATDPDVILMDEPCSALDPRATLQIEQLMAEIKERYTIVIVTHNMQQAARASDMTVFLSMAEDRAGYVVEQGNTVQIFTDPKQQLTEDYVSGRFG